ncbi:MAG: DUF1642 domain-containing protein [Streptococcus parasanguinis]|nr:DUF1642 domain-containing protein [Streptococcus parasanguinis]
MNKQELIKKYENTFCTIISINGVLEDLRQLDEPQSMKLKDVIARIKKLDLGSQELWLNEILNKLGSDYGSLKYRAGYEQGKFDCAMERDKVTVPQFVADYIRYAIENDWDFQDLFKCIEDEEDEELLRWVYHERNQETLAAAWINGYTVEKEKRYIVKMSATKQPLFYNNMYEKTFFSLGDLATRFTRKQLEGLGLGWVFDCPGIEIEEVGE